MIYYLCSNCGRRVPTGQTCECKKEMEKKQEQERQRRYDQTKRDRTAKKFYNSSAWHQARKRAIAADHGIDVYALMKYGKLQPGNEVHHIVPRSESQEKCYDLDNLMTLSTASHAEVEQRYKNESKAMVQEELRHMLQEYRNHFRK